MLLMPRHSSRSLLVSVRGVLEMGAKDWTGWENDDLRVVRRIENYVSPGGVSTQQVLVECKNCGKQKKVIGSNLKSGNTQSCDCKRKRGKAASDRVAQGARAEIRVAEICAELGMEVYLPYAGFGKVDLRQDAGAGWRRTQVKSSTRKLSGSTQWNLRSREGFTPGAYDVFVLEDNAVRPRRYYIVPASDPSVAGKSTVVETSVVSFENRWDLYWHPSTSYEATKAWADSLKQGDADAGDNKKLVVAAAGATTRDYLLAPGKEPETRSGHIAFQAAGPDESPRRKNRRKSEKSQ